MAKEIQLNKGRAAIVDDGDHEWLSCWEWGWLDAGPKGYAVRREGGKAVLMHRAIVAAPDGLDVDHWNRDTLDNRRGNLRVCTVSQNLANAVKLQTRPTSSRFKGVYWDRNSGVWRAHIKHDRQRFYLGRFSSEAQAAATYDRAALHLYGCFARLNFPDRDYSSLGEFTLPTQEIAPASTSRFRGVSRDPKSGTWRARLCFDYQIINLGSFPNETEAARAYDAAARKHLGASARLNFPGE